MALELLSHSILLILDRQAKDQLHTGKYADPSPELIEQTKSVPKTKSGFNHHFLYFITKIFYLKRYILANIIRSRIYFFSSG
jgi:hypothetical protein